MHGTGMFDKPGVFYSNKPTVIFDDNWLLDYSKIASLKQHNLAIIDLSSEHYGVSGLDYVYHALDSVKVNFLLLSHNPNDHKKFARMLFYPYWYHWARKKFIVTNTQSVDRTYKWSCLNGNPRNHRIYNYFYSKQQPYFDSCYFTFHSQEFFNPRHDDVTLPTEVVQFWANVNDTLPDWSSSYVYGGYDAHCGQPGNTDSYINLVTETTVIPYIFASEKIWKPVALGQLFLVFGNPGLVSYLRNQGVDVFDDIIDHSYDSILDWQLRLHQIHNQLENLLKQDLKNIYINTSRRRQENTEKFFSGSFDRQYLSTLEQCINTLN